MEKQHKEILSMNYDFLVNETPMTEVLEAIREKHILTSHDFDQLRTLRHQGRKALARYFLGVLPHRGPEAYQAFLDSLQDANAQHLVDLLMEQADKVIVKDGREQLPPPTPSDSPLPSGPDPHEYVVLLTRNNKLIRRFVDPAKICPMLTQNKIMTPRESDTVTHLHGKNKKWDLVLAVLLQRGERAYQAFMAALLKNGYSTIFHTIKDTNTKQSYNSDDDGEQVPGLYNNANGHSNSNSNNDDDNEYDEVLDSDEEIKTELNQNSINASRLS